MTDAPGKRRRGGQSIFGSTKGGQRVQANLPPIGARRFELARQRLGRLSGLDSEKVSDANVITYLALGEADTIKALRAARGEKS